MHFSRKVGLNYSEWIERERRIRVRILQSSPLVRDGKVFRVCQACEEICLCHEEVCPNCNSLEIKDVKLVFLDTNNLKESKYILSRIRCLFRFQSISKES
jgi:hypothetical protein